MPTSITSSGITFDDATTLTTGVVPTANIANGAVTPVKLSQPYTLATSVASTSGTSIDFTGIPSWAKRVTVMFAGVSTSGTSDLLLRVGSGSFATSGYASTASAGVATGQYDNRTDGFLVTYPAVASASVFKGAMTLLAMGSNVWVESGNVSDSVNQGVNSGSSGSITLSGALDRVRITTVNGTDTFDGGTINISYEG